MTTKNPSKANTGSQRNPSRRRGDHHELNLMVSKLANHEKNSRIQIEALKLQVTALQQRLKLMADRLGSIEKTKAKK